MIDETNTNQKTIWPPTTANVFETQVGPIDGRPSQIVREVIANYGSRAAQSALEKVFTDVSVARCVSSGFLEEVDNSETAGVILGVTDIGRRQLAEGFQDQPFGPGTPEIVAARQMAISAIIRAKHPEYLSAFNGGSFPMGEIGAHPMMTQTSRPELHRVPNEARLAYYSQVAKNGESALNRSRSENRSLRLGLRIWVGLGVFVLLLFMSVAAIMVRFWPQ